VSAVRSRSAGLLLPTLASVCALAGFGTGSALAGHEHDVYPWLHGIVYGSADSYVHVHMHEDLGTSRASWVTYGICGSQPYFHNDVEQYHFGANNGWDIATGAIGEGDYFFSGRAGSDGSMAHHHHSHYFDANNPSTC
jgi:hypothetical protein